MFARFAALVALLIAPAVASAQALADRVPADTLIYVGWRGAADLGPGYPQSNLKGFLDQSQIPEFIDKFIPAVLDKAGQLDPQAGEIGKIVAAIGRPTWQHPTAFFFAGVDAPPGKDPVPHLGIIWQPGADGDALAKQLEQLAGQAPVPFPIKVVHNAQIVALVCGYDNAEAALPGRATKALADDPTFKAAMGHLSVNEPVTAAYIDFEHIFTMAEGLIKQSGDKDAQRMWPKFRDDLGIGGLKRLAAASGFDGKDYGTQAFVEAPEPRTGLLKLVDGKIGDEILATIPATATMAGAGRFNATVLYDTMMKLAEDIDPQSVKEIDRALDQIHEDGGVDIHHDLLASLGDEWAYFADPTIGGRGVAGFTIVNHLKDAETFERSLSKIEDYALKQMMKEAGAPGEVKLAFQTVQVDGMTVHYLAVPFVSPSWVVHDGNLYVALFPQVAAGAARHVSQKGPSIAQNEGWQAISQRMKVQNPAGIQFMDLPKTAPDAYGAWLFISHLAGFGDLFGVKSPPLILPELGKLQQFLAPAGSVSWADAEGFHVRSIEPFPGSTVIASDPMISLLYAEPAMIATLLPSLNRAREQANRVKSASNLRQIGLAAVMYANNNKGKLPDDFKAMIVEEDLVPQVFVNPRGGDMPAIPPNKDQWPEWVEEHSDYVWLGKGKSVTTAGPETVIAHEKLEENPEGVNLLFGDGHVEWMPASGARETIERSKQQGNKVNGNL
ncbi:MAG TPA: H-X9-DG-CTERM domain-containing protein [Tepidisphaeraceae bacterium]|nr:H-X9-DG-CTERM domain-containing protein [Tepidisphaeraceae bacterium]